MVLQVLARISVHLAQEKMLDSLTLTPPETERTMRSGPQAQARPSSRLLDTHQYVGSSLSYYKEIAIFLLRLTVSDGRIVM